MPMPRPPLENNDEEAQLLEELIITPITVRERNRDKQSKRNSALQMSELFGEKSRE